MDQRDIIRAWRDEEFRSSLCDEQRTQLPTHPAGLIELPDEELDAVAGGIKVPIPPITDPRTSTANWCQTMTEVYNYLRTLFGQE